MHLRWKASDVMVLISGITALSSCQHTIRHKNAGYSFTAAEKPVLATIKVTCNYTTVCYIREVVSCPSPRLEWACFAQKWATDILTNTKEKWAKAAVSWILSAQFPTGHVFHQDAHSLICGKLSFSRERDWNEVINGSSYNIWKTSRRRLRPLPWKRA